jgi:hypothetical protein
MAETARMILVPWKLQMAGTSASSSITPSQGGELGPAPSETVACVIFVESKIRLAVDDDNPAENGIPLGEGEHQLPVQEGAILRFVSDSRSKGARVSVVWLKLGPRDA